MLVPFWFQGPDYVAAPLLLTGRWKKDGGHALWVTPLFHLDTKADGSVGERMVDAFAHLIEFPQGVSRARVL